MTHPPISRRYVDIRYWGNVSWNEMVALKEFALGKDCRIGLVALDKFMEGGQDQPGGSLGFHAGEDVQEQRGEV